MRIKSLFLAIGLLSVTAIAGPPYSLRPSQQSIGLSNDNPVAANELWEIYPDYRIGAGSAYSFFQSQQIASGLWYATGPTAKLRLDGELAGWAPLTSFGLYVGSGGAAERMEIFSGAVCSDPSLCPGQDPSRSLSFGWSGGGLQIQLADKNGPTGASITSADGLFGWYLHSPDGIFYSEDSKNSSSAARMLAYVEPGAPGPNYPTGAPYDFLFAWAGTRPSNPNRDFNDMLLVVEGNIAPVPEPGAVLLSSTALLGVLSVLIRRRRSATS